MKNKKEKKVNFQSREINFLNDILSEENATKISHPILGVMFGQVFKLLALLDGNPAYTLKVKNILDKIKERWSDYDEGI